MALFVVKHQHDPKTCPAGHPQYGPMLLKHLAGAKAAGVDVQGEAVVNGGHQLFLIANAKDASTVKTFMQPFAQMGSLEVLESSHCDAVVARGKC
jgi:hypothetical protein